MRHVRAVVFGVALGITGLLFDSPPPVTNSGTTTVSAGAVASNQTTTTVVETCGQSGDPEIDMTSPMMISVGLADWLECVGHVTLVDATDSDALASALAVATHNRGPLVVFDAADESAILDLVDRLDPDGVTVVGQTPAFGREDFARLDVSAFAPEIPTVVEGTGRVFVVAAETGVPVQAVTAALARAAEASMVVVSDHDPRAWPDSTRWLVAGADQVTPVGFVPDENFEWQLAVARRGLEVPGGGQLVFGNRRIVALYGHPEIRALGVMGEQGAEEAAELAKQFAVGYDADGMQVVPAFEIIATIASAEPTRDNDYSMETEIEVIREWVEVAALQDMYVVLDLQPGRTDFLTQAKMYEDLLKYPHVGLALDPEWRLKPNQLHLRQVGSVDAVEVNQVIDWLSELVRTEALPQKLFLVHQFNLGMITQRGDIKVPPELAVVIQMDGQGPLGAKYGTWRVMVRTGENPGWEWGWKNFIDEDTPTATATEVLGIEPVPVFVSYQ